MHRRSSARVHVPLAALLASLAACDGSPTAGGGGVGREDLDAVAATLGATADSMQRRGDSTTAPVLTTAAEALRIADTVGVVRLALRDTTLDWFAVAQRWTLASSATGRCAPPASTRPVAPGDTVEVPPPGCGLLFAPVLVLWRDGGARVLLVHGPTGTATLGRTASLAPDSTSARPAYAVLVERAAPTTLRGIATEGSVTVGAPRPLGACAATPRLPAEVSASCTRAAIEAAFSMTLAVMAPGPRPGGDALRASGALPPVYVPAVLAPSVVPGISATFAPGPRRTVVVPPQRDSLGVPSPVPPLLAALVVRRDSASGEVAFHFMVRNGTRDTLRLVFPTARRFTVTVRTRHDSTIVWDSSHDPVAQVADTVRLAPGNSRSWVERWIGSKPSGTFAANAMLDARDLRPGAGTLFALP